MGQPLITTTPRVAIQRKPRDLQRPALMLVVPLLPLITLGASTFSVGAAIGLLLAPIGIQAALRYRGAGLLLILWALCLVTGPILASITADELSRSLNQRLEVRLLLLVLNAGVSLYVLLWSRSVFGSRMTAALYAVGLIAEGLLSQGAETATNPWKYAFALPVAVLLLALARSRAQSVLTLGVLAGFSILEHSRSFAAISMLAAVTLLVAPQQSRPARMIRARTIAIVAASAVGLYLLVSTALVNGWFGTHLRNQAIAQTRDGEVTLLVGARPEWAAGLELFHARPVGFGPGVVPNVADVTSGLTGLVGLGVNRENQYLQEYLFGNRLELHSVIGDLWLMFGFAGILLASIIVWRLSAGLISGAARGSVGALGLLLAFLALWDMAFSPVTNLRYVVLALALLLIPRNHDDASGGSAGRRPRPSSRTGTDMSKCDNSGALRTGSWVHAAEVGQRTQFRPHTAGQ